MSRIPLATYRLQFNSEFTFKQATALVPYLHELGISHCYASPYLKARAGSPHGYDIVDHNALNPEIGNCTDFEAYAAALKAHGMGQILDLVPNHMGVGSDDNQWWLDVLENGPASAYAAYFDIDWRPLREDLRGKVLLPVLAGRYGTILESGQLKLVFDGERGEFSVYYFQHRFPMDPKTYPQILSEGLEALGRELGEDNLLFLEFQSLITSFSHLPSRWELSLEKREERRRDKEIHKKHLADTCVRSAAVRAFVESLVTRINGSHSERRAYDKLHQLLEVQAYRLAHWRVASDEINYRRFFDINDLAGLRMEEPQVFQDTHRLVGELLRTGYLDGLRIDHPDGLYDPVDYFHALKRAVAPEQSGVDEGPSAPPFYLVAEKILASYERLPQEWPVHGTTGYDFLNQVNSLFVYPGSEAELTRFYQRFAGHRFDFDDLLFKRKKLTIEVQLSSELTVLANMLDRVAQANRHTRDYTLNGLREALIMVVACFPVYRTYVRDGYVTEEDRRYVEWAIAQAKKRSPAADITIFDFVRDSLLLQHKQNRSEDRREEMVRFAMKFQQYTAPVMAKALEDSTFYIYNRLISLNEVGGDPRRFGASVAGFHRTNQERLQQWPHGMLSTSTHDTKRSEDVRARIDVISEMTREWQSRIFRWSRINRSRKSLVDSLPAPSRNDEYLIYQTLLGVWPLEELDREGMQTFRERIKAYAQKAVKEAKVHTSWLNPNSDYEAAVERFVTALLNDAGPNRFLADFLPFQQQLARLGLFNSLSQLLLKLTSPGVPNIYQGNELWDFSLVDPDNRRPVDYERRRRYLAQIRQAAAEDPLTLAGDLLKTVTDGRIKLYLTWRTLELRRQRRELFEISDYIPLSSVGSQAEHLCAFARQRGDERVIVAVPRWFQCLIYGKSDLPLGQVIWTDTLLELPKEFPLNWKNLFTAQELLAQPNEERTTINAAELFRYFPWALLTSA